MPGRPTGVLLAASAWVVVAVTSALIGAEQVQFAQQLSDQFLQKLSNEYSSAGAVNLVGAGITLLLALVLLRPRPSRSNIRASLGWAVLSVGYGVYQVSQGAGGTLLYMGIIAAGVAAVASFSVLDDIPAAPRDNTFGGVRYCVNCASAVAPDRVTLCQNCGKRWATRS